MCRRRAAGVRTIFSSPCTRMGASSTCSTDAARGSCPMATLLRCCGSSAALWRSATRAASRTVMSSVTTFSWLLSRRCSSSWQTLARLVRNFWLLGARAARAGLFVPPRPPPSPLCSLFLGRPRRLLLGHPAGEGRHAAVHGARDLCGAVSPGTRRYGVALELCVVGAGLPSLDLQWAVGITAYALMSGCETPFDGPTAALVEHRVCRQPLVLPLSVLVGPSPHVFLSFPSRLLTYRPRISAGCRDSSAWWWRC
jgi:hypothetical protein